MAASNRPPRNAFVKAARTIYNPVGFSKGYNAILWFIFSGALFGFTLARFPSVNIRGVYCGTDSTSINSAAPGECFYYLQDLYGIGMFLHLLGVLPASLFTIIQFIPVVRHKAIIVHRISGYLSIILSLIGCAGAVIIAPISFGGSLEIRAAVGFLTMIFVGALLMGYINIKRLQIEQHRMWMLRAWFYAGSIITLRMVMIIAAQIISAIGSYYVTMPCDKIAYTITENLTQELYPACGAFFSGENAHQHVAVLANMAKPAHAAEVSAALDATFGMAAWISFAIHIVGVEIYIKLTPAEHDRLRHISYERQLKAGFRHPGRAGLTIDRFGDSERWKPSGDRNESDLFLGSQTEYQPKYTTSDVEASG